MANHMEKDLLDMAVEITVAAVSNSGDKTSVLVSEPDKTAAYLQTVYGKLKEINDSID